MWITLGLPEHIAALMLPPFAYSTHAQRLARSLLLYRCTVLLLLLLLLLLVVVLVLVLVLLLTHSSNWWRRRGYGPRCARRAAA